jgi:pyruvate/2-oxoglutarate dehydrogenase complex dihydrolipoamide acyltransferase (E2) component
MAVTSYKAQWRYRSNLGAFAEGDVIRIEPEEAEWFNRDSPGVLVPIPESSSNPPEEVEGRALEGPPRDRMFRGEDVEVRAEVPEATPAAVRLAEENGIDLAEVEGTGADGKIVVGDIKKLIE